MLLAGVLLDWELEDFPLELLELDLSDLLLDLSEDQFDQFCSCKISALHSQWHMLMACTHGAETTEGVRLAEVSNPSLDMARETMIKVVTQGGLIITDATS